MTIGTNSQHSRPDPWEIQDDEPARAYAAFLAYRDLGPDRTIRGAYRQHSGNAGATFTAGFFSQWAKQYEWERRARAWDGHVEKRRQQGIDRTAEEQGAEWEGRRNIAAEADWTLASKLREKAAILTDFPIATRQTGKDGLTVIEPTDAQTLRRAASVAQIASALAWGAIDRMVPPEVTGVDPPGWEGFDPATCDDPATLDAYIRALEDRSRGR